MADLNKTYEVIKNNYMIRRKENRKEEFRRYLLKQMNNLGYALIEEKGNINKGLKKINYTNMTTDNEDFKLVLMAHYDTAYTSTMLSVINFFDKLNPFFKFEARTSTIKAVPFVMIYISLLFFICFIVERFLGNQVANNCFFILMATVITISVLEYYIRDNKKNANDNTSGVLALLDIADKLSKSKYKNDVLFIFTDNEERGLIGAKGIYKHKKNQFYNKPIINLDCIGNGDTLIISYGKEEDLKDKFNISLLNDLAKEFKNINIDILKLQDYTRSDQKAFIDSNAISIGIYKKYRYVYDLPNIHTNKDDKIDLNFINVITTTISNVINKGEL